MHTYLLFFKENENSHCLIKAKNKKEAFDLYCENIELDDLFVEYVHDKAVNMSWIDFFWSKYLPDFNEIPIEDHGRIIKNNEHNFINEIKIYFNQKPEYAELFLNYWFSDKYYPEKKLPDKMLRYIFKKELDTENWDTIQIIDIKKFPHIGFNKK